MAHKKPLQPHIVQVAGWTAKGLARLRLENKEVEMVGAFPGETVEALVGKRRQAWLSRIVEAHPGRREAPCPHFGTCGGCSLQSLEPHSQLQLKTQMLERRLRELFPQARLDPPMASPQAYFYRSKVEFSFQETRDGMKLGYNWRGRFDRLLDVQECFIGPLGNRELLRTTRAWAHENGLSAWHPRNQTGLLRYLLVRRSHTTRQWLAVLVTSPEMPEAMVRDWADRVTPSGPSGLIWARQTSPASAIVTDSEELLQGSPEIEEWLESLRFRLGWRSFFQSNPAAYLCMLQTARDWVQLAPGAQVLDLYCGIGTIGLFLCPPGGRLVGVESVEPAVLDARRSALENERTAQFECCQAQDWPDLTSDLLILDPPRSGCHPKMIGRLLAQGPEHILYISCNPHRLLEELNELGASYVLERAQLFDFFPQTRHVEALCLLRRATSVVDPI